MNEYQQNSNNQFVNPYVHQPYFYPQASQAYYPYQQRQMPQQSQAPQQNNNADELPIEQSYIENILRLNLGKQATLYMTFDKNAKTFTGVIKAAGRDHIIISDPETGKRYLLLMIYLDYITFDEAIDYSYPFHNSDQLSNYPPR